MDNDLPFDRQPDTDCFREFAEPCSDRNSDLHTGSDVVKQTGKQSKQQLEHQITKLSAELTATEYQFLRLLAEFDRRRAWANEGTGSCAHWLSLRCGISLGAAREKIRVAHTLKASPRTSEAFNTSQLSYSIVRSLPAIATPTLENSLMVTAQNRSASHTNKVVRIYSGYKSDQESKNNSKTSRQYHYTRSLTHYWDKNGYLVITTLLPPEQGAAALDAAADE